MMEIQDLRSVALQEVLQRSTSQLPDVSEAVRGIINEVRAGGDAAVQRFTQQFDGAAPQMLRVSPEEIEAARSTVGDTYIAALEEAAANIRAYHVLQKRAGFAKTDQPGVVMGQMVIPLRRVGVYVPGGTAAYPSTVLMDTLPAVIAGVEQVVMVTPPAKDGSINAGVLAAASVAGVQEIYKVGGAQAIAVLAYGTESIAPVDKIVGPGNLYVATAKQLVYGVVDIDMIAGPSEVLIVADDSAEPRFLAADMLAQAEHDVLASSVLVTTSRRIAEATAAELERQLPALAREDIARRSLEDHGRILLVDTLQQAIEAANLLAPEHLELCVAEPFELLGAVRCAGSIFLGHYTPEALGDYYAGPNHTLPTGGTARFASPLSVDDFVRKSSYLYYTKPALEAAAPATRMLAESEGLTAHANSVAIRTQPE